MNGIRQSGKLCLLEKRKWQYTWLGRGLPPETLIEVGCDHRLADEEPLEAILEAGERQFFNDWLR